MLEETLARMPIRKEQCWTGHRVSGHQYQYALNATAHMAISPRCTKAVIRLPSRRFRIVAPAMNTNYGARTRTIPVATGATNPIDPATWAIPINRNATPLIGMTIPCA